MTKEVIAAVIEAYAFIGTSPHFCIINNAFGLFSNDGKQVMIKADKTNYCHKQLRYADPDYYDQMITSYPKDDEFFFDFIKNTLYRKWSEHFHREIDPETEKPYIRVTGLDTLPANVLQNFCIASRMPVEFPQDILRMKTLISAGLHPVIAFALRQARAIDKVTANTNIDQRIEVISLFQDHSPITNTSSLRRLVSCDPHLLSGPYKSNPKSVTPTNCIWGETEDLRKLKGKTIREFWNTWKEENADILHAS